MLSTTPPTSLPTLSLRASLLLQVGLGLAGYLVGRFFTLPLNQWLVLSPKSYAYATLAVVVAIGGWEGSTQLYRAFQRVLRANLPAVQWIILFALVSSCYALSLTLAAVYLHHGVLEVLLHCAPTPLSPCF